MRISDSINYSTKKSMRKSFSDHLPVFQIPIEKVIIPEKFRDAQAKLLGGIAILKVH